MRGKRWVFTLNNYTSGEKQLLADLCNSEHVEYGCLGYEEGEQGTPHIQGYVIFADRKTFNQAKALLGARCHLEISRGTPQQASDYCKKGGDYDEFGECQQSQGKRTDWERLKDWCAEQTEIPSDYVLFSNFPSLFGRYKQSVREICRLCIKPDSRTIGEPREWQRRLEQQLDGPADGRHVTFVVDEDGNSGKTWFVEYYTKKHPQECQRMKGAKRDDLALCLIPGKRVYFIDVARGSMEHFQYSFLEMIKDRAVFSPKYESCMKEWDDNSHCVVLCNEMPDMNALTRDRYVIFRTENINEYLTRNN